MRNFAPAGQLPVRISCSQVFGILGRVDAGPVCLRRVSRDAIAAIAVGPAEELRPAVASHGSHLNQAAGKWLTSLRISHPSLDRPGGFKGVSKRRLDRRDLERFQIGLEHPAIPAELSRRQ